MNPSAREKGNMAVFGMTNLSIMPNKQNIAVYLRQCAHSLFTIGTVYITLKKHLNINFKQISEILNILEHLNK